MRSAASVGHIRNPRFSSSLGLLLAGSAVLCSSGCQKWHQPKYEVGDRKILLVPFRDLAAPYGHGYGDTARGRKVIDHLRSWVEENASPNFYEGPDLKNILKVLREWTEPKITSKDWRNLLAGVDTDLVLVGEIRELRHKDPMSIGMYRGKIRGSYVLVDSRTGRQIYQSGEVSVEFPKETELDIPIPEFGTKPEEIERGLLREYGARIGRDLYGYYTDRWRE